MRQDARERLNAAIARKNAERGRPLTAREKLENLEHGLGYTPGSAPWWPRAASAIEARRAATPQSDAVEDESVVPKGDAQ